MEDFKEKYNQALEKARGFHDNMSDTVAGLLEVVFPELKKTEDEKMSELLHKVICNYINSDKPYGERELVSKKLLPYVEKIETYYNDAFHPEPDDEPLGIIEEPENIEPF